PNARFPTALAMADELSATVAPAAPQAIAAWLDRVAGDSLEIARERVAAFEREGAEDAHGGPHSDGMRPVVRAVDDAPAVAPAQRPSRAGARAASLSIAGAAILGAGAMLAVLRASPGNAVRLVVEARIGACVVGAARELLARDGVTAIAAEASAPLSASNA